MLKNLLFIAGFSFFVVVVFIATNIYLEKTSTTISPTTQQNLEPIEGTFNSEILNQLKSRVEVPVDLKTQSAAVAPQPTNTTPSPSPRISTTITPTPSTGL